MSLMKKPTFRCFLIYTACALFVFVFGQVYTYYGHGVTSDDMTFCFLPTLLAAIAYLLFHFIGSVLPPPSHYSATVLAFAVTSHTLRMIVQGVLDIAGAYSRYFAVLNIAAQLFVIAFIGMYLCEFIRYLKNSKG